MGVHLSNIERYISGLIWLTIYQTALVRAIWEMNISVDIILDNSGSVPIDSSIAKDAYEEGLEYVEVAAEIIKRSQK